MFNYILVALGSAVGGVSRYWIAGIVANRIGQSFPWDTLVVNVTGSFFIGFLGALNAPEGRLILTPYARNLLMIGFCGGYTTFSAFSLQTVYLLQEKEWLYALGNAALSVALCLFSVWGGLALAALINSTKGS
jgi:fluoride exporter